MRTTKLLFVIAFCMLMPFSIFAQTSKKVAVIGIDGTLAEAITPSTTPFIYGLLATSTYSFDGQTVTPTMSCTGWSNLATGVWPNKHNVMSYSNDFSRNNYSQWPDLFTYIENANSSLVTGSFCTWGPLTEYLLNADTKVTGSGDAETVSSAIDFIQNENPDVVFVSLDDVDHAGHVNEFSTSNNKYMQAVETADQQVEQIIATIENRPNFINEDWVYIVTTDHGGINTGHGGGAVEERTIFLIVNGGTAAHNKELSQTTSVDYSIPASVNLDGSSDFLVATDKRAFEFGTNQNFTLECKVKLNSVTSDPVIIGNKDWASGYNKGFVLSFADNVWKFNIADGDTRADVEGMPIEDNKWHHIAVTVDRGNNLIVVYQDGVFVGAMEMVNLGDVTSGLDLAIGQDGTTGYSVSLNSSITDVRVWNKALTADVIKQWFNQTVTSSHPDYSSMNAYWKLDEGSGTALTDSKGNNPLIYNGNGINWNGLSQSNVPTIEDAVKLVDVTVTALDHLGIYPSNLDGNSLLTAIENPPVANFTSDVTTVPENGSVSYYSTSSNAPTSYSWTFEGGTPSTSTDANPVVQYNNSGSFNVSLTVSNDFGSDTKTVTNYITVNTCPVYNIPGLISAVDYCNMYGVDGNPVGYIDSGDWMEYEVNVSTTGNYNIEISFSSPDGGAQFEIQLDGDPRLTVDVPATGSWGTYSTITEQIALDAGVHTLKIYAITAGYNLQYFDFNLAGTGSWIELTYDDFENGFGNWTDGGADCSLYTKSSHAYEGSSAMNIQDNSGVASSFYLTNGLDITAYEQIKVEFVYKPKGMESGEDFWIEYYDGSSWETIEDFISGVDFSNDNFYSETIYIEKANHNFPTDAKFRFMCDASDDRDDVFIDNIKISATTSITLKSIDVAPEEIEQVTNTLSANVYPNPVSGDSFTIELKNASNNTIVSIYSITGELIANIPVIKEPEVEIPVDKLSEQLYIVKIVSDKQVLIKKVVVK